LWRLRRNDIVAADARSRVLSSGAIFLPHPGVSMSTTDSTTTLSRRPKKAKSADAGGVAAQQLRAFVDRIERLEEEKKALADDIKEVYAEAKGNGFDTKILRKVIALRKRDLAERQEEETILDLYLQALGMKPGGEED
jgi:uncharacterized protein (UPF0335 family)